MPRVTKSLVAKAKHKKILKATKGHYGARSRLFKTAKQSNIKSLQYAFRDRKNKKRVHFHRFMKLLHEDLDKISGQKDPLKIAARNISKQTEVLCFDEFYVEDIKKQLLSYDKIYDIKFFLNLF